MLSSRKNLNLSTHPNIVTFNYIDRSALQNNMKEENNRIQNEQTTNCSTNQHVSVRHKYVYVYVYEYMCIENCFTAVLPMEYIE